MFVTTNLWYVEEIARTTYLKENNTNHAYIWENSTKNTEDVKSLMLLSPVLRKILQTTNERVNKTKLVWSKIGFASFKTEASSQLKNISINESKYYHCMIGES